MLKAHLGVFVRFCAVNAAADVLDGDALWCL